MGTIDLHTLARSWLRYVLLQGGLAFFAWRRYQEGAANAFASSNYDQDFATGGVPPYGYPGATTRKTFMVPFKNGNDSRVNFLTVIAILIKTFQLAEPNRIRSHRLLPGKIPLAHRNISNRLISRQFGMVHVAVSKEMFVAIPSNSNTQWSILRVCTEKVFLLA